MANSTVKILHVEDDKTDALLVCEMLCEEVGAGQFDLVQVDNLRAALKAISENDFDAILLDLNLRDVSGTDNVKAIKEQNPDVPVVILSGVDSDRTAVEAIGFGAQEYLVKGRGDSNVVRMAIKSSIKRKEIERRFFKQANYDDLTGLPNARLFQNYLQRSLDRALRWNRRQIVMFIDIDGFKQANDGYGHLVGDHLLQMVAGRLGTCLRNTDTLARWGGDEFVVLLDDRSEDFNYSAAKVANKLLSSFHEPLICDDYTIKLSLSIGIAIFPLSGSTCSELMERADKAMYVAKRSGGDCFHFSY